MAKRTGERDGDAGYLAESRSLSLSIVSILPLIIIYHAGIVQAGHSVRNLAEVWLQGPLGALGLHAAHLLNAAVVLALVAVLWRSERHGVPSFLVVLIMIAEGIFYALLLQRGGVVLTDLFYGQAQRIVFAVRINAPAELMLGLGAGVYEELLFRLLLLGGVAAALGKVFLWHRWFSLAIALIASSLLFSAVHHVGALGEPFDPYTFTFRAVCGALLGLIYIFRGLGVAVWTHAAYNALTILAR